MLVDCGEGTQRQLMRSVVGLVDVDLVLLTHLHTDHWLGLPGLLKTMDLREREAPLTIAGPEGTRSALDTVLGVVGHVGYPLSVVELAIGDRMDRDGWAIEALEARHRTAARGYLLVEDDRPGRFDPDRARAGGVTDPRDFGRLQRGETVGGVDPADVMGPPRRGRRIVISGDTRPAPGIAAAAEGADLLVHEATFTDEYGGRARKTGHSTASEAASLAAEAGVATLALVHLSARHRPSDALDEARAIYPGALLPRDFDVIEVPFPERGPAVHVPRGGRPPRTRGAVPSGPADAADARGADDGRLDDPDEDATAAAPDDRRAR